jgi:serine/threonine protein kinase
MTTAKLKDSTSTLHADRHLIAGRYRTHDRIGRGRLGEIFAAIDEGGEENAVEQHLAIQIVPESVVRNNRLFNRLNLGYTQLRACAHPNIVNYLQFGRYGKLAFVAMELLDGASLRFVLDDAKTLPLDEVKPIIRGLGEALELLHAKDMVHGNLTTKNVFITDTLEARLLDVVPVDPAESIVGGNAMSDPFSRCTVEDDVFGLACLAYEMLAGKHPFNFCTLAEARLAGLEAERIDSLTDSEWSALSLALSFDREQRTSSVEHFVRNFGIRGTEKLQPMLDQPVSHKPIVYPAVEEPPQIADQAVPAHHAATAPPVADVKPAAANEIRPTRVGPIRKRVSSRRPILLGILLAALGAWSYYGQPQEQVESLISYIDANSDILRTLQGDVVLNTPIPDPVESISTDRVVPVDFPTATAPAASEEDALADSEANQSDVERGAAIDANVPALAQPTNKPALADPSKGEITTGPGDQATNLTENGVAADNAVEATQMQPEMGFVESVVSVPERDGAARIALARTEYSAMPLIWWTNEHSATADTDFISVEQQAVADVSIDGDSVLHIPLVDDSLPEPQESFFVSLGVRDPQQGRIERIATVRVDIVDDD